MGKQNAVDSLRESIRLLEVKQAEEGKVLKEQFRVTYESLRPVNLLKSTVKELSSSVEIRTGLLETIISVLSGYFTQKMIVRSGSNPLLRIAGVMLQVGVASFVAKNIESIRNFINQQFDKMKDFAEGKVSQTEEEESSGVAG